MTPDQLPLGDLVFGMVPLGKKRGAFRYAVYLLSPSAEPGSPLWGPYTPPGTTDKARKAIGPQTWPGMVYHPRPASGADDLPAWHFALDFSPAGWGTDHGAEGFAHALASRIGRPIKLRILHGWNSRLIAGDPCKAEV